jgi:hypothetical protein
VEISCYVVHSAIFLEGEVVTGNQKRKKKRGNAFLSFNFVSMLLKCTISEKSGLG